MKPESNPQRSRNPRPLWVWGVAFLIGGLVAAFTPAKADQVRSERAETASRASAALVLLPVGALMIGVHFVKGRKK